MELLQGRIYGVEFMEQPQTRPYSIEEKTDNKSFMEWNKFYGDETYLYYF